MRFEDDEPQKPKRRKRPGKKPRGSAECNQCRLLVWGTHLDHSGRCGDCVRFAHDDIAVAFRERSARRAA